MRPIFFKAFGYVTLFVMIPILMGLTSDGYHNPPSFREQLRTLIGLGVVTAIGLGLVYLQKWAAIYFSVPLFCYGAWLAITSIEPIPFPLNLAYICWGVSFMLPLFVTIRVWSQLSWCPCWFSRIDDARGIIRALAGSYVCGRTRFRAGIEPARGEQINDMIQGWRAARLPPGYCLMPLQGVDSSPAGALSIDHFVGRRDK